MTRLPSLRATLYILVAVCVLAAAIVPNAAAQATLTHLLQPHICSSVWQPNLLEQRTMI